jgi:hypothetical protein
MIAENLNKIKYLTQLIANYSKNLTFQHVLLSKLLYFIIVKKEKTMLEAKILCEGGSTENPHIETRLMPGDSVLVHEVSKKLLTTLTFYRNGEPLFFITRDGNGEIASVEMKVNFTGRLPLALQHIQLIASLTGLTLVESTNISPHKNSETTKRYIFT